MSTPILIQSTSSFWFSSMKLFRLCYVYIVVLCIHVCTIAASKIKGTAREIYRIFPCNGDFPCMYTGVYTGKIPASKATKSHMT